MIRAKQLQPLSRQHHLGLHIARHARVCINDSQQIFEHWQALSSYMTAMREHLHSENNLIVNGLLAYENTQPKVASVLDKLQSQQRLLLQQLADIKGNQDEKTGRPSAAQVRNFATALYEYIRFEERELLPVAEQYLPDEALNAIYKASPDSIKHVDEWR